MTDHADTIRRYLDDRIMYASSTGPSKGATIAALDALVAERDELRRKALVAHEVVAERDVLQRIVDSQGIELAAEKHAHRKDNEHLLAEVQRLRDALEAACGVAIWMSGAEAFSPEGEASEGWVKQREKLYEAMAALAREEETLGDAPALNYYRDAEGNVIGPDVFIDGKPYEGTPMAREEDT